MKNRLPEYVEPILLPQASAWSAGEDVADYAQACMSACGLDDWQFRWDRAVSRLGCCKMARREISLSRYFVAAYLERDQNLIRRTILHELAHALAWVRYRERGHGAAWRLWCAALGIADEKSACKCESFAPPEHRRAPAKFALCHCETGEVYRYYSRQPRMSARKLKFCYIPGKKSTTLGKLCVVSLQNEAN